ncbi:MAG: hypothetical protein PHV74_06765 [Dehalococcoidia bacterium]|nr:hypothetical protein [Dehalococcoidia bacterium]
MISPKLMMFFALLLVMGQIISMGCSGTYTSDDQWDDISNDLTGFSAANISGLSAIPVAFSGFITHGLPRMLSWNYAFLQSDIEGLNVLLMILRTILIIVVSCGMIWGIVSQFQSYMIPALIGSGILWGIGSLLS